MSAVSLLVAGDPAQTTGGYIYDNRIAAAATAAGRPVTCVGLGGRFPEADDAAAAAMDRALAAVVDDQCVIIDGLALGGLPDTVGRHARRLRLVALVHHPLADEAGIELELGQCLYRSERRALTHVHHIVVTSAFTATRLGTGYGVSPARMTVIEPGLDKPAAPVPAERTAVPRLLCVASVIPRKGHRVLIEALARLTDLPWVCECIGDLSRDRDCVADMREAIAAYRLGARVRLAGSRPPARLAEAYARAYLFVLPSYYEGYGMVVTEALAHGRPVITTTGGALSDTLPPDAGVAVPPGDAEALAAALRQLLCDPDAHTRLAAGARRAAAALPDWADAGRRLAALIDRVAAA